MDRTFGVILSAYPKIVTLSRPSASTAAQKELHETHKPSPSLSHQEQDFSLEENILTGWQILTKKYMILSRFFFFLFTNSEKMA